MCCGDVQRTIAQRRGSASEAICHNSGISGVLVRVASRTNFVVGLLPHGRHVGNSPRLEPSGKRGKPEVAHRLRGRPGPDITADGRIKGALRMAWLT
jgi:hypothetical protein